MNKILYSQIGFPTLQNRVYETKEQAMECQVGDITLVESDESGLIFNITFDGSRITYDEHYDNEQSHSQKFRAHLKEVAELIEKHIGKENLVEVGCGKGFFLEMLLERGVGVTGFDPAYTGTNERIQKKFFEPGILDAANGLILRHVLEHIQHPVDFLFQLKKANNGRGLIYIEVPCFDWIMEQKAWYDIFYEHVNYFRLSDFERIFSKTIASGYIFGQQYLYIIADLAYLQHPIINLSDRVDFPVDFLTPLDSLTPQPLAVWGAASKGTIFTLLMHREKKQRVKYVIDINPAKQGKYLPGTGVEILSPTEALKLLDKGTSVVIMNPNYTEEIQSMTNDYFNLIPITK